MKTISAVMSRMSFGDYVSAAEQAERERIANERLAAIEKSDLDRRQNTEQFEQGELLEAGRPEYKFAKNAKAMNKKYKRHIEFRNYEAGVVLKKRAARTEFVNAEV